jgi:transcriptional regulator with XRE-family HTH domain
VENDMAQIGKRIRALRKAQGMTQAELAEDVGFADESVVSKVESGTRGLAVSELAKLCGRFGVRSDDILFGSSDAQPVGVLLRGGGHETERVVERVEAAFADLRYVRALIES